MTKTLHSKFSFEAKKPNADYSDWDPTSKRYVAAGFLVISTAGGHQIDATLTAADGTFSIQLPVASQPSDSLTIAAVGMDGDQVGVMVANPKLPQAGEYEHGSRGSGARAWAWTLASAGAHENGDIVASVSNGSAAAWVFADAYATYQRRKTQFGKAPVPLVVWVAPEITWECGACAWTESVTVSNVSFGAQIVLGGGSDESFWSDAVVGHELGHWVMGSYGVPPGEGGTHYLSHPTFPGQAWSEGWATYHQAALLNRGYYFDKQRGSMFWMNLETHEYSGHEWSLPVASAGLLQRTDENEVSAMLWSLHRSSTNAPAAIFAALASPRMTSSPFARGYTTHHWDVASDGTFSNVVDTHSSAPCFADFLDALNCAGFSRSAIDQATNPTVNYPYPTQSPRCH